MIGVMSPSKAMGLAEEAGLDLVEISPNAKPPVCKIMDYGKYKYIQQKKANEAKKKQKTIEVKEIKIRPGIEEHDFQVKLKHARKFIAAENKIKFTLRFRGREMAHQHLGMEVLKRMEEELGDTIKIDQKAKLEGRQMIMVVSPNTATATK